MKTRISDMADYIQDDTVELHLMHIASAEKIKEAAMLKLHTDTKTDRRIHNAPRVLLIAAIIAAALSISAFALWHFGLKDLKGPNIQIDTQEYATLSLNGIMGTPEYEAAQEWEGQINAWWVNGENMIYPDSADQTPDAYYLCHANSQEAKDTLDAILEKYGLHMHEGWTEPRSVEALYETAGTEDFLPPAGSGGTYPVSGMFYDDGTFTFNYAAALPDGTSVCTQLYCLTKGTFTRLGYLLGNADDFQEWTYTAADGTQVLLAMSSDRSILAADLDNCFIFANILSGTDNSDSSKSSFGLPTLDRDNLQYLADSFDFAAMDALSNK